MTTLPPQPAAAQAALPPLDRPAAAALLAETSRSIAGVLRGHPEVVQLVLAAVLARGHVLLEDVPGVGKTTLARTFAKALGCSFARIQFTADMLPSDVLGVQVLDMAASTFRFKKGPIFAEIVLADEINRASPKTQSAMLEAMGEAHITLDDSVYPLPEVFCVLATQNPVEHHGAYPLPESQLDRFMVRLSVGYPPSADELQLILQPQGPTQVLADLQTCVGTPRLLQLQALVRQVRLGEPVAAYLLALVQATRSHADIVLGCSPRGSLALAQMARAWAFVQGRDFVLPDDVKALVVPVLSHRLALAAGGGRSAATAVLEQLVESVAVPR
jgi:MoxR-like ATPase